MKIDPEDLMTISDVTEMFDVGQMTIWSWRNTLDMPVIEIPGNKRNNIRFDKPQVIKWAKMNNKEVVKDILTTKEKKAKTRPRPNAA